MLKRILLFLLLMVSPATAQVGSTLTLTQMTAEINRLFPDNNTGLIIPADARKVTLDLANSASNLISAVNLVDPNPNNDTSFLVGLNVLTEFSGLAQNPPGFLTGIESAITTDNGDNYFTNLGVFKTTPSAFFAFADFNGGGQKFGYNSLITCNSMGDCFYESMQVTFAGGPIGGDEGQGFSSIAHLAQQSTLQFLTIGTVARTTCNTTTTQPITASEVAQTFTVASTTGCNKGDWIVLDQQITSPSNADKSAAQITAVGSGTLTAEIRMSYNSGVTVTPALVLGMTSSIDGAGQFRVMVDESGASYTTGTAQAANAGGSNQINGTSTSWSTSMVGGTSTNIGCWESSLDDYTSTPFGSGSSALHSWYEIGSVTSATALTVVSWSTANSNVYRGFAGNSSAAYTIRPCVNILWRVPSTNTLIAETTSTTWSAGDTVEIAISPYPDVTGEDWTVAAWTPGGSYRRGLLIDNVGGRHFQSGLEIEADVPSGGSSDGYGWVQGIYINGPMQHGIQLQNTDAAGEIDFSDFSYNHRFNSSTSGHQLNGQYGSLLQVEATANQEFWGIATDSGSVPGVFFFPNNVPFADLPTCSGGNGEGFLTVVSDSTSHIYGASPVGGGSERALVFCDGGAWAIAGGNNNPFQVVNLEVLVHTGTVADSVPIANTCGGFSLATGSSDTSGEINLSSATSCGVQFGTAYANAPFCVVTPAAAVSTSSVATSAAGFTATFGTAQTAFFYHCMGI